MISKKHPADDTTAFDVTVIGRDAAGLLKSFRRCDIVFTTEVQRIQRATLTADQAIEMLNTPALAVSEVAESTTPGKGRPKSAAEVTK